MQIELVSPPLHEALIDLLVELHGHYNVGSAPREQVRAHLRDNLLAPGSPLRLVTASRDGVVLGLAAIVLVHSVVESSPDRNRQCQLKELYVRATARGHLVGTALMRWVARYAVAEGCHRIDWPVQAANDRGLAFYRSLGAQQVEDRLSYRLTGPALTELVALRPHEVA